jgi:glycosyltransferase involved in cell wall biosynthesis
MKVAVVTDYFPISSRPWNGHSAYQTLRILARRLDLRVFYPEAAYPRLLRPPGFRDAAIDRNWSPPDVPVTYIPYPVLPILTRPLNGYTSAHRLLPHVRRFRPDVVLNYGVYPYGLAAVRIGRALGVPSVLKAIGSDLNRISDPLCAALTRATLRQAGFVTTVSADLARTAVNLGADPEHTRAILNGCDTALFHPRDRTQSRLALNLDPEAEIVLYVGRLDLRKGLLELIDAIAQLRARPHGQHSRLRCFLIGDGPDRPALVEAIAQHGCSHAVTLVPACPTERIAQWMAAANLITLPSYAEGCPNVVIEGLSAGRPVVATRVGGIPELMNDESGRLVPARNVPALLQALEDVLTQPWNAEEIAARHRRSWSEVAQELYAVLAEATATSPPPQQQPSSR